MTARICLLTVFALALPVSALLAERPAEAREKADLVIVGTVQKLTATKSIWGSDGVSTSHLAEVVIDKVEGGRGARAGETVKVGWYRVTKAPSKPLPGAYGHSYPIKAKDKARFWLRKQGKDWTIIYNSNGIEKLKE